MHYIRYTVKVNCYGKSKSWAKLRPKIVNLEVEKKEEILLSPIVLLQQKPLYKAKWQHRNAAESFGYITIEDRIRTVSWRNDNHHLVWLNLFLDPIFPLSAKIVSSNGHNILPFDHFIIFKWTHNIVPFYDNTKSVIVYIACRPRRGSKSLSNVRKYTMQFR